jgi:hypothetical protein
MKEKEKGSMHYNCHFCDQNTRFSENPLTSYSLSTKKDSFLRFVITEWTYFEIFTITWYVTVNSVETALWGGAPSVVWGSSNKANYNSAYITTFMSIGTDLFIFVLLLVLIVVKTIFFYQFICLFYYLFSASESYRIANGRMHLCKCSLLSIREIQSVLRRNNYRSQQQYEGAW